MWMHQKDDRLENFNKGWQLSANKFQLQQLFLSMILYMGEIAQSKLMMRQIFLQEAKHCIAWS